MVMLGVILDTEAGLIYQKLKHYQALSMDFSYKLLLNLFEEFMLVNFCHIKSITMGAELSITLHLS